MREKKNRKEAARLDEQLVTSLLLTVAILALLGWFTFSFYKGAQDAWRRLAELEDGGSLEDEAEKEPAGREEDGLSET